MKKNVVMYGAAFALAFSICTAAFGQAPALQKSAKMKGAAMSVRLVELQITVPGCQTSNSKVLVKAGNMAKLKYRSSKCNYAYGFVPVVRGNDRSHAEVTVLRLTRDKNGKELTRKLERFPMAIGESKTTAVKPRLTLKLLAITGPQSSSLRN